MQQSLWLLFAALFSHSLSLGTYLSSIVNTTAGPYSSTNTTSDHLTFEDLVDLGLEKISETVTNFRLIFIFARPFVHPARSVADFQQIQITVVDTVNDRFFAITNRPPNMKMWNYPVPIPPMRMGRFRPWDWADVPIDLDDAYDRLSEYGHPRTYRMLRYCFWSSDPITERPGIEVWIGANYGVDERTSLWCQLGTRTGRIALREGDSESDDGFGSQNSTLAATNASSFETS